MSAPAPPPSPSNSQPADFSESYALERDRRDPLPTLRAEFAIPRLRSGPHAGEEAVYLCGNSLGLMPLATREAVIQELDDWARLGVEGHFHARHPWYPAHEFCREAAARLVGARPHEVVVMNGLTANLHLMMTSFYRPGVNGSGRTKIVIEDSAFPSDSHAVQSQAALHGLDPGEAVVRLRPRTGEHTLRTDDVVAEIERLGETLALVMLGGVNYLTGQALDMPRITEAGHRVGARVGWDLAHAAGNIPLALHDWNADFACWCSYKYLNSGAGAVAGCFIHERHVRNTRWDAGAESLPRFAGWWGNDPATRFRMGPEFIPVPTADAWSLSNPPVLALSPVRVSLGIFDRVGISNLRSKSERLTTYLQSLLDEIQRSARGAFEIITPRDLAARGCQFSIAVTDHPRDLFSALTADGVMCDFREPNVIRIAPVPLYNTFHDCWRFAQILHRHAAR